MKSTFAFNVKMTKCYGDVHLPMPHTAYWARGLNAILFSWMNNSMDIDVLAVFIFLTLLEVLNPTSFSHALIEPFVMGKIKCVSGIFFLLLKISCRRTPETDSPNPWGLIEPRLRIPGLCHKKIHFLSFFSCKRSCKIFFFANIIFSKIVEKSWK